MKRSPSCAPRRRPAASAPAGTSSRKGQDQDFERVVDVFRAHDVGYFFYIGGNDSQDTAHKVSTLAHERGLDLVATGVPKTIDNDLGDPEFTLLDHSPGYGSVARYYAHYVRQANEENSGSAPADPVLVIQAMGRKIGFIPAAARLADPERKLPIQIYLTESGLTLPQLGENVLRQLETDGRCIVVVSEGFDVGDLGTIRDNFGHVQFSSSQQTVAQIVVNYLNTLKFPVPGKARGQVPGTDQRNAIAYASVVDLEEAYGVGCHAVEVARKDGNGWMATILRDRSGTGYSRPLRQGAAREGGELRAVLPQALARSQPDRRHRRVHRLRPAPDRRGLGERAHGQGPPPVCPDRPQVRAPEAAGLRAPDLSQGGLRPWRQSATNAASWRPMATLLTNVHRDRVDGAGRGNSIHG